LEGKEGTSQEPTYFTKNEILYGTNNLKKIECYGFENYIKENSIISKFRGAMWLKLIVTLLNKEKKHD
jgi:hypothetical protein